MDKEYSKLLAGYKAFKDIYVSNNSEHLSQLEVVGQNPAAMVVACSDSRVDPALVLQADLGDLFVVRNVANIIPEYHKEAYQGTAAALKFGIDILKIPHLIILGHSSCAGIASLIEQADDQANAITRWVAQVGAARSQEQSADECAQKALHISRDHCMSYPWIVEKLKKNELTIHLWFFVLSKGTMLTYQQDKKSFEPL